MEWGEGEKRSWEDEKRDEGDEVWTKNHEHKQRHTSRTNRNNTGERNVEGMRGRSTAVAGVFDTLQRMGRDVEVLLHYGTEGMRRKGQRARTGEKGETGE